MRTATLLILLIFFAGKAFPSENLDIGIFGGTSYYMGNINTSRHFYNLSPAFGAVFKYNFNEHYSIRTGLNYGEVKAFDADFGGNINQARQAGFVNNFYDISLQGEFNFRPFKVTIFAKPFTTFITAGLAYMFVPGTETHSASSLNLPFGGGVKYGLSRKVTIGMEWILKKSFSDDIDGVKSFGQFNSPSLVHNNDWVSLAGFFITIKPFERRGDCPAYWN